MDGPAENRNFLLEKEILELAAYMLYAKMTYTIMYHETIHKNKDSLIKPKKSDHATFTLC